MWLRAIWSQKGYSYKVSSDSIFKKNRARSAVHVGYNVARERAQIDRRLEKMHFIKFHIIAQLELNQKYIYLHFWRSKANEYTALKDELASKEDQFKRRQAEILSTQNEVGYWC